MRWRCARKISVDRRAISSSRSLDMVSDVPLGPEQRAAEDRRARRLRPSACEQRDDGAAPRVVTLVSARGRDATAEEQAPVAVIDHRLAGRRGAEATGLGAAVVTREGNPGDRPGPAPEVGLLPVLRQPGWLHEDHVRDERARYVRHQPVELLEARARAR